MALKDEEVKSKQIFILLKIGNMNLTEINTLTDNERYFLSNWFIEENIKEEKSAKDKFK